MPRQAKPGTVLLVEPDPESARDLTALLVGRGLVVTHAKTGAEAIERLEKDPAHMVVSELVLPDTTGVDLLKALERLWPGLPLVMLASNPSVSDAMAALRAGASDLVQKPVNPEEIGFAISKALTVVQMRAEHPPPPSSHERAGIIGDSATMRQVYATLERAAQGTATVLVRGESGTGKELAARAIHDASPRAAGPFVKIDCASLPEHLLESELFGYEKGAFTGAVTRKPGRAELADKGTLILDEIGELSLPLQAKLLRLLQDRQIERLGGTKVIAVDVRVVAATHRDLESMVERQQFRLDLFYRLNVVPLWLPPLRARREDIDVLVEHFCKTLGRANGKPSIGIDKDAVKALRGQRWPGNVRQLQNFVERLVVLSNGPSIREEDVRTELSRQVRFATQPGTSLRIQGTMVTPPPMNEVAPAAAPAPDSARRPSSPPPDSDGDVTSVDEKAPQETQAAVLPLDLEVRTAEKKALERALVVAKHNRSLAARLLGVSRSTLYAKLEEHGLL
jgi:two-component system response regulator AtoC